MALPSKEKSFSFIKIDGAWYWQGRLMGEGSAGSVRKAVRLRDGKKCVIKRGKKESRGADLLTEGIFLQRLAEGLTQEKTTQDTHRQTPLEKAERASRALRRQTPVEKAERASRALRRQTPGDGEELQMQAGSNVRVPLFVGYENKDGTEYLVMDRLPGENLGEMLRRGERFCTEEIIRTGIALASFLELLHSHKPPILYLDLHPDNILLARGKREICLVDFGAAAVWQAHSDQRHVFGTRGFAPPEQEAGKPIPSSDLYALGIFLHLMQEKADRQEADSLLDRLLVWCTQDKPQERCPSAGAMKKALQEILAERGKKCQK